MTRSANLLVELFVEELPPKALKMLGSKFAEAIGIGLIRCQLTQRVPAWRAYASPRRLAAWIPDVLAIAPDRPGVPVKIMPVSVGLDAEGRPTTALLKKLGALGADVSDVPRLVRRIDGKAESLYLERDLKGAILADALQSILKEAVEKLPIPKVMEYQLDDGWTSVKFVRPAHGLVALHGADVVPVGVLGLQSGRTTRGHRFEAATPTLALRTADSYVEQLRDQGAVIAGFKERREEIERQLVAASAQAGLAVIGDDDLLDEVTALVERPNVLTCEFDPEFLQVPAECLVLTMKANRKYFPLVDAGGALTNHFLVVSNISPADPGRIVEGNERVIRPRLADAKFFYDQDRRTTLGSRVPGLDKIVYHRELGHLGDRVQRVRDIARALVEAIAGGRALADQVDHAALLAKADLVTSMVGEFPELQGLMGRYYAFNDGEDGEVAFAIEDHYRPRFAGDELPRGPVGAIVAVADKLEALVGMFGVDELPTGDKDPFALRRQALGVLRILTERLPDLRLDRAIDAALDTPAWPAEARAATAGPDGTPARARRPLIAFFSDRLAASLVDRGYTSAEIGAVLAEDNFFDLAEVEPRLVALRQFEQLADAAALAGADKRVRNILKKSAEPVGDVVDPNLLREPAEIALAAALREVRGRADAAFQGRDYAGSLHALAGLRAPVDAFFDAVMVNTDDPALRANRLALLASLHAAMNRVADLSRLA